MQATEECVAYMRDTTERLRDIHDAIAKIMKYTNQGRHSFDQNELVQSWVIYHLRVIGEAARTVPQDFKGRHPEIPWERFSDMRHMLLHNYFEIDPNSVWKAVEHDLPNLKTSVDAILNTEGIL